MSATIRKRAAISCFIFCIVVAGGCAPAATNDIVLGPGSGPGALDISGDSLHKLASDASLWSKASVADRRCLPGPNCTGGGTVRVRLFAARGAKEHGARSSSTVLIGKMINDGRATTKMYGLEPGYDYLVFLVPGGTADTGKFVIERVSLEKGFAHKTAAHGAQIPCNHPGSWGSSFAVFWSCSKGRPDSTGFGWSAATLEGKGPRGLRTANMLGIFSLFRSATLEDPAWYTCNPHGCCTSGSATL